MISEHSHFDISGEYMLLAMTDGKCQLGFQSREMTEMTPKQTVRILDEMIMEIGRLKERVADLGMLPKAEGLVQRALEAAPAIVVIFNDVHALNSGHARDVALERFYAVEENRKVVLTVSNCEPVTHNKDSENVYVIRGYTKPRKNPLRAKFVVKAAEDGGLLA